MTQLLTSPLFLIALVLVLVIAIEYRPDRSVTPDLSDRLRLRARARARIKEVVLFILLLLTAACRQGMYDQPKFLPLQENGMYPDRNSSRPLPPGTLAQETSLTSSALVSARVSGNLIQTIPIPVTKDLLERGRERFNIFCSPCHDRLGYGTGMVVRRGFRNPPSYHIERLVNAPDGYFFEVITQGYGTMYRYADRVAPPDRWAITAYIRVLQLSQRAPWADVPPQELDRLAKESK